MDAKKLLKRALLQYAYCYGLGVVIVGVVCQELSSNVLLSKRVERMLEGNALTPASAKPRRWVTVKPASPANCGSLFAFALQLLQMYQLKRKSDANGLKTRKVCANQSQSDHATVKALSSIINRFQDEDRPLRVHHHCGFLGEDIHAGNAAHFFWHCLCGVLGCLLHIVGFTWRVEEFVNQLGGSRLARTVFFAQLGGFNGFVILSVFVSTVFLFGLGIQAFVAASDLSHVFSPEDRNTLSLIALDIRNGKYKLCQTEESFELLDGTCDIQVARNISILAADEAAAILRLAASTRSFGALRLHIK